MDARSGFAVEIEELSVTRRTEFSATHIANAHEVTTVVFGLLLAGHETTTSLLGNALRRMLTDRAAEAVGEGARLGGRVDIQGD